MISWLNSQDLHLFKSFHCKFWFVLLCTYLEVEAEVSLRILSFIKEGLKVRVERFKHFVRSNFRIKVFSLFLKELKLWNLLFQFLSDCRSFLEKFVYFSSRKVICLWSTL